MKQSDKSKLRSQAARFFKSQNALGVARGANKRSDHTSAGIHSVRTLNEYINALTHAASELGVDRLKHLNEEMAVRYMLHRFGHGIGAKGLARDRAALERFLGRRLPTYHELHKLDQAPGTIKKANQPLIDRSPNRSLFSAWRRLSNSKIPLVRDKSLRLTSSRPGEARPLRDVSRAYTDNQIKQIALSFDDERSRLAVIISRDAGLRAHELLTLRRPDEGKAISNQRDWRNDRHALRSNAVEYIVTGKGGLVRTVKLSKPLAERLEALRLETPRTVEDRKVLYTQRYDLAGGKALGQAFTEASKRELGYSLGHHGLRHSYAQSRVAFLTRNGIHPKTAKHIVSQEMGHMRMKITNTYLR